MITTVCGGTGAFPPPDPESPCCYSSANGDDCTCWIPVLDTDTAPLQEGPQAVAPTRCHDCAYRKGSPEREANDGLQLYADPERAFHCHQGMPRVYVWRHPESEAVLPPDPADYQPVQRGGQSWRADGTPALICAGWAAVAAVTTTPRPDPPWLAHALANARPVVDLETP